VGIFGLTYGEDIHSQMRVEDLSAINPAYDHILWDRKREDMIMESHLKEAFEQASLPESKLSIIILKRKLDKLDPKQLVRLRDMMLVHRVKK
jgi:hypothetical protein